jgi:hypothetical protein
MIRILKDFKWGDMSNPQRMQAGNIQKVPGGVSEKMLAEWIKLEWVEVWDGKTVEKAVEKVEDVYVEPVVETPRLRIRKTGEVVVENSNEASTV